AGNVILTGRFTGTVDFGAGNYVSTGTFSDAYIAKLDPAGNPVWSKHIGGDQDQMGDVITTDPAGSVYAFGRLYAQTVDFGGGPINGGGYLVKYDAAGTFEWVNTYDDEIRDIVIDTAGDVVFTGYFPGTSDFGGGSLTSAGAEDVFLVKLDTDGNHVW